MADYFEILPWYRVKTITCITQISSDVKLTAITANKINLKTDEGWESNILSSKDDTL